MRPQGYSAYSLRKQFWVYYIGIAGRDVVKIGSAQAPYHRLNTLQCAHPDELQLLAIEPGGKKHELGLHHTHVADRIRGEWFTLTAPIRQRIADAGPPPPQCVTPNCYVFGDAGTQLCYDHGIKLECAVRMCRVAVPNHGDTCRKHQRPESGEVVVRQVEPRAPKPQLRSRIYDRG